MATRTFDSPENWTIERASRRLRVLREQPALSVDETLEYGLLREFVEWHTVRESIHALPILGKTKSRVQLALSRAYLEWLGEAKHVAE